MKRESLELLLDQGLSVDKIARRFGKDPSTISYWMGKYGLQAVNRDKHVAKGGIEEAWLVTLVQAGRTIAEIAEAVGLSKSTVRHWLRVYGLRTQNSRGRRSSAGARQGKEDGSLTMLMCCERHGDVEFTLEGRGYYRCKRCRTTAVVQRRRRVKVTLVAEAGGKCAVCGYDRYVGALEFHHLDPAEKRHEVGSYGVTLRWMPPASRHASASCCARTVTPKSRRG